MKARVSRFWDKKRNRLGEDLEEIGVGEILEFMSERQRIL